MFSPEQRAYFVQLGLMVMKGYAPGFLTDPGRTDLSDLGFEIVALFNCLDLDDVVRPFGFIAREIGAIPQGAAGGTRPEVIIAIRGTEGLAEWIADADRTLVDFPVSVSTLFPKAHRGFAGLYNTMRTTDGLLVKHSPAIKDAAVRVVGHSLGSALATLLAADIGADELTTFASPRVGNQDFCECAAKKIGRVTRFVNAQDVVPKLPVFGYADLSAPVMLDSTGQVKDGVHAWHTMATYLHLIDPAFPLDADDLPT